MRRIRKILIMTEYFLPFLGGIEVQAYRIAREFSNRGFYVEIYTQNKTPLHRDLPLTEVLDGIKIKRIRYFKYLIPQNILRFDLIILFNFLAFPYMFLFIYIWMLRSLKVKTPYIVLIPEGGHDPNWKEFSFMTGIIKKLIMYLERHFIAYSIDKIIAVSTWEYISLANFLKENRNKIVLIPNCIDEYAYEPIKNCDQTINKLKPYVLYLGRIARRKRIDMIIEAVKDQPRINIVVVGPIHEIEAYIKIKQLVKLYHIENRFYYFGPATGLLKYCLIDNSLAVILISEHEAEGIVVKEAMARGKPVIVNDLDTFKYLIKNQVNGFIVKDINDIMEAINRLMTDQQLVKLIEVNNKYKAKMWMCKALVSRFLEVIKQDTT